MAKLAVICNTAALIPEPVNHVKWHTNWGPARVGLVLLALLGRDASIHTDERRIKLHLDGLEWRRPALQQHTSECCARHPGSCLATNQIERVPCTIYDDGYLLEVREIYRSFDRQIVTAAPSLPRNGPWLVADLLSSPWWSRVDLP